MESRFPDKPATVAANTQLGCSIAAGDTTTAKTAITGAAEDSLVQDLVAVSSIAEDEVLRVLLVDGATELELGAVTVPANAGNGTVPSVSLLNETDMPFLNKRDDRCLPLAFGQELKVAAADTVAAGAIKIAPIAYNYYIAPAV